MFYYLSGKDTGDVKLHRVKQRETVKKTDRDRQTDRQTDGRG